MTKAINSCVIFGKCCLEAYTKDNVRSGAEKTCKHLLQTMLRNMLSHQQDGQHGNALRLEADLIKCNHIIAFERNI